MVSSLVATRYIFSNRIVTQLQHKQSALSCVAPSWVFVVDFVGRSEPTPATPSHITHEPHHADRQFIIPSLSRFSWKTF